MVWLANAKAGSYAFVVPCADELLIMNQMLF